MSLEDDSRSLVETIDGALGVSFGVDPDRDHDEVCALATTGYVVSSWRNTVLEDIHNGGFVPSARRGSCAHGGIRDRDMARLNVAAWRQIRPHVHPTGIDVMAVRDLLRDKKRPVTIGKNTFTCGDLFDNTIQWLMRAKYDRVFSDAIRTWKLDRGGNQTDPAGDLWFPPGVPELPKHLR